MGAYLNKECDRLMSIVLFSWSRLAMDERERLPKSSVKVIRLQGQNAMRRYG